MAGQGGSLVARAECFARLAIALVAIALALVTSHSTLPRRFNEDTLEVKIWGNWVDIMFSPRRPQRVVQSSEALKELLAL